MELRQLEYFAAVARHRHFSRAADESYVTQSALSQQVRRLEEELGLLLLRRTPHGVELTPAGRELAERAEAILAEVAEARAAMDGHAGVERGAARIAATAADAPRLPEAIVAFHAAHPGIQIALRHGSAAEAVDLLRRGAVDLAITGLRDEHARAGSSLVATTISDEPLRVIGAVDDPLLQGGEVTIEELRGAPFILAERQTALREVVMGACVGAGFSPVPLLEVGDPAVVRVLAHSGLGIAAVPASWLELPGADVGVATIAAPAPRHRVALLAPADGTTPAGRMLAEHVRAALGRPGRA